MLPCARLFNAQADACSKQKADTAVNGCGAATVVAWVPCGVPGVRKGVMAANNGAIKQVVSVDVRCRIANGILETQRIAFGIRCAETVGAAAIGVEGICAVNTGRVKAHPGSFSKVDRLAGAASVSPCRHKEG